MFNLNNKTFVITGTSSGIGFYLASNICKLKCKVIGISRKKTTLSHKNFKNICGDINSINDIEYLYKTIKKKYKKIDVLINNAAVTGASYQTGWNTIFEKQSIKYWNETFEVNVTSVFHFSQKFFNLLKRSNDPAIINIASLYGVYTPDFQIYKNTKLNNPAAYSSSKAALIYLTKWLSKAMSPKVRVNSISPGGVENKQSKKFKKQYLSKISLKKMNKPLDIINLVDFLISEKSNNISGQNFLVDGGWNG